MKQNSGVGGSELHKCSLVWERVVGNCEYGNELTGFVNCREFLDLLNKYGICEAGFCSKELVNFFFFPAVKLKVSSPFLSNPATLPSSPASLRPSSQLTCQISVLMFSLCNITEERRTQRHRGGSIQSMS